MKSIVVVLGCALASMSLLGQSVSNRQFSATSELQRSLGNGSGNQGSFGNVPAKNHQRIGIVSDWSQRHVLFSPTNDPAVMTRIQQDPRWLQSWYLHHRQVWWGGSPHGRLKKSATPIQRDWNISLGTVTFGPIMDSGQVAPGGGQTFPAKYTWDVTQAPDCTRDYIAMGLPATPASGGQANIVGFNNLYSNTGGTGFCTVTGPSPLFAYASGTGEVPASLSMSLDGSKLAYVEDIFSGSSYFHVLKIGTTGSNGTPTAAAVPGVGNNASDVRVLLSPDSGLTNQSSTTAPFIDYQTDAAYITTYDETSGTGYLYRIHPVFGGGTPSISWSVVVNCASIDGGPPSLPSSPVYDGFTDQVFFTDTGSRVDHVRTPEGTPALVCGGVGTFANTAANPPVVDGTNLVVYGAFDNDGADEYVTQRDTSGTVVGSNGVELGLESSASTGPYDVDFDNDYYYNCNVRDGGSGGGTCTGNPLLYTAARDFTDGSTPTLYAVGFNIGPLAPDLKNSFTSSTPLATGAADSSPVTEYYNATTGTDYLFVGVTNNCAATTSGGTGGCIMSLNITNGPPTVTASTTALAAPGGPTGMVIDNDSTDPEASSIYYVTKGDGRLVKATQSLLH